MLADNADRDDTPGWLDASKPDLDPSSLQHEWNKMFQQMIQAVITRNGSSTASQFDWKTSRKGMDIESLLSEILVLMQSEINLSRKNVIRDESRHSISDEAHFTALAHSVGVYLEMCLEPDVCDQLAGRFAETCAQWFLDIMHHRADTTALFDLKAEAALVTVLRASLFSKCPECIKDGVSASPKQPVFYIHKHSPHSGDRLCMLLGLPCSSARVVPCNSFTGSPYSMDMAQLEEMINTDLDSGRLPFCVVLQCGILAVQHTDNIPLALKVCTKFGVWSHVVGPSTVLLMSGASKDKGLPASIAAVSAANSFSIETHNLFLGTYSEAIAPVCTFYNRMFPEATPLSQLPLPGLVSLLFHLQRCGTKPLQKRLNVALETAKYLSDLMGLLTDVLDQPYVDPSSPHVVCFRFRCPQDSTMPENKLISIANERVVSLFGDSSSVPDGMCLLTNDESAGVPHLVCFDPLGLTHLATSNTQSALFGGGRTASEQMETMCAFVEQLGATFRFVYALATASEKLMDAIKGVPGFELEDTPTFDGIACIRCTPSYLDKLSPEFLADEELVGEMVSTFNESVASALQSSYPDVFCAVAPPVSQQPCVGIRSLDTSLSIDESVLSVLEMLEAQMRIEEEKKVLETLGNTIQQVISMAEQKLEESKDEAISQEGLLRQIPLIGSIWNMISPVEKVPIKGWQWQIPPEILDSDTSSPPPTPPPTVSSQPSASAAPQIS
eukprot:c4117_g1_i1.p1 GENE.c4117_g1_i1~~c4117_g1_i1.p1  ORF type:complete len:726 (+),score=195.94 c4117_g1_i1:198-2375(+)